jgi:hypothetical protein
MIIRTIRSIGRTKMVSLVIFLAAVAMVDGVILARWIHERGDATYAEGFKRGWQHAIRATEAEYRSMMDFVEQLDGG